MLSEHRQVKFGPTLLAYYGPKDPLPHPHAVRDLQPRDVPLTREEIRVRGLQQQQEAARKREGRA